MKTAAKKCEDAHNREEFAKRFIGAYDEAMKIMQGKKPRPKTNWDEQFAEWDNMAEEVKNERNS